MTGCWGLLSLLTGISKSRHLFCGEGESLGTRNQFQFYRSRLLSLAGRLTEDDMFSTDLTEEELDPILNSVKIPIQLCFSENDEYVPDISAQKKNCREYG